MHLLCHSHDEFFMGFVMLSLSSPPFPYFVVQDSPHLLLPQLCTPKHTPVYPATPSQSGFVVVGRSLSSAPHSSFSIEKDPSTQNLTLDGKISAYEAWLKKCWPSFYQGSTDSKFMHFSYVYLHIRKLGVSWLCFLLIVRMICGTFT